MRITSEVRGRVVYVQDFISPDRQRMTIPARTLRGFTQKVHLPASVAITIGDSVYTQDTCSGGQSTAEGWTKSRALGSLVPAATFTRGMLQGSSDVRALSRDDHATRYSFTPRLASKQPGVTVSITGGVATVRGGWLRSIEFDERLQAKGSSQSGHVKSSYSHFGTVPPIEPPPAVTAQSGCVALSPLTSSNG